MRNQRQLKNEEVLGLVSANLGFSLKNAPPRAKNRNLGKGTAGNTNVSWYSLDYGVTWNAEWYPEVVSKISSRLDW